MLTNQNILKKTNASTHSKKLEVKPFTSNDDCVFLADRNNSAFYLFG